jgi:hypothetical protein
MNEYGEMSPGRPPVARRGGAAAQFWRRLRAGCRVRTRRPWPGCRRRWARGGSVKLEACRRSRRGPCRGGTCPLPSGRRSRSCGRVGAVCGRSPGAPAARLLPSRGNCGATPRPAAGAWGTGPRRRWHADRRARRPKAARLAVNEPLRRYVEERLSGAVPRPGGAEVAARPSGGSAGGMGDGPTGAPGSAAATRTPTGCCASTSRREPTSAGTAPAISPRLPRRSTAAPARHSAGRPRRKPSTNSCARASKAMP